MGAFRYQAVEASGNAVTGVIEAEDRRSALRLLSTRGIFASQIEAMAGGKGAAAESSRAPAISDGRGLEIRDTAGWKPALQGRIRRKEVTEFSRELSALLGAAIPIPQALDGLGQDEENPALKAMILKLADSVRKGASLSAAMEEHPKQFNKLYASMVRVGEEAGQLPAVMNDLASLLEHEEEVRSEVVAAVSYPAFVLAFGAFTVAILLTVVLPKLFGMMQSMVKVLPWPTLVLLKVSGFLHAYWPVVLVGLAAATWGLIWYAKTPKGALNLDRLKLRLPILGGVFLSSALSRFSRTLGTLVKAGVSLLPALKIVENTIGNRVLAQFIAQVSEETRGGDSLAGPLRKLGVFPKAVIQMIDVGEESGKLDEMLLRVAEIQEREMRAKTKMLVSLLAPALILVVGALVGFIVIAILLPIFRMSHSLR